MARTNSSLQKESRISIIAIVIFLFGGIIIFKLFSLQVVQGAWYALAATEKHEVLRELFPERGSIYVRENNDLYPIVTNSTYYTVYAEPNKIESPNKVIDGITSILGLEESEWKELLGRLADNTDPYEPIKKKVPRSKVQEIEKLELDGVGFIPETYRFYSEKDLGGHIFGFISRGDEQVGQYGIEGYFEDELNGEQGSIKSIKDAAGALVTVGSRSLKPATDGVDLVLTIDRQVQFTACEKLKKYYEYFEASSASVIIMDPNTGAITAMCSFPDFDPENYNQVEEINYFNNPAIFYDFEPGSIFKSFTMAAAIDTGKVKPSDTYVDEGEVEIGPYTIRNADLKAHGEQTMIDVLDKSLNTGTIYVADRLGKSDFKKYVERFGFGQLTNIELDTEVKGNIDALDKRGEIYYLTGSYGQGITATPIQLVSAYAALVNGGSLYKPYIVEEKIYPSGKTEVTKPDKVRQVIDKKTSTLITGMLTSVVENGYGAKAGVDGYYLAGKTGTAQVASEQGGYGQDTIHSFVGFGPVSNPKFVMLVKLDRPKGIRFASDSVTPLFGEIAKFLVSHYQLPPDY